MGFIGPLGARSNGSAGGASSEQAAEFVSALVSLGSAGSEAGPRRRRPSEVSLPHPAACGLVANTASSLAATAGKRVALHEAEKKEKPWRSNESWYRSTGQTSARPP